MSSIFSTWRRRSPSMAAKISGSTRSISLTLSPLSSSSVRRLPPPNLAACSGLAEFARRGKAAPHSSLHLFQVFDLLPAALVALALDLRAEIRVDDGLRELDADDPFPEREQV